MRARIVGWMVAGALIGGAAAAQPLTDKTLAGYERYLTPRAEQLRWMKVDWHPSFWDGVVEAHRQKKPVLIWAMNGHPLGCT